MKSHPRFPISLTALTFCVKRFPTWSFATGPHWLWTWILELSHTPSLQPASFSQRFLKQLKYSNPVELRYSSPQEIGRVPSTDWQTCLMCLRTMLSEQFPQEENARSYPSCRREDTRLWWSVTAWMTF